MPRLTKPRKMGGGFKPPKGLAGIPKDILQALPGEGKVAGGGRMPGLPRTSAARMKMRRNGG